MDKKWLAWLTLILLSVVWGTSFILIKRGLDVYSPLQVACIRIGAAGLALLPVSLSNIGKVSWSQLKYILLFGLCNAGLPAFLFAMAQTKINSSTAGILNSLTPIFTFIAGVMFFSVRFNWFKIAGTIIGFIGAAILIYYRDDQLSAVQAAGSRLIYFLMIIFATVLYGFSANIIKAKLQDVPGKVISSFAYIIFGIPMMVVLFSTGFIETLTTNPKAVDSLIYVLILGVFGSALAIILFSKLIQQSNALFASFVTYLIPFVAILWGVFIGENISIMTFLGLFIILGGIAITGIRKKEKVLSK